MDSIELERNVLVVHQEATGSIPQEESSIPDDGPDNEPDDEDPRDRDAFEIEKAVMEFRDEPSVFHDEYPDSESDEDDEAGRERRRDNIRGGGGNLYYHQKFFSAIAFKEAVLDHALKTGCNIAQYRYDKDKLGYNVMGMAVFGVFIVQSRRNVLGGGLTCTKMSTHVIQMEIVRC
ncbi:hypothetical protein AtNW77_Chr5g0119511 [Arabidopsis thaliana]